VGQKAGYDIVLALGQPQVLLSYLQYYLEFPSHAVKGK
jgi:hypothetical protein